MTLAEDHRRMLDWQLRARGIDDPRVLNAFEKIPREMFVPEEYQSQAYEDHPIPIGFDQTISQPYIVGLMVSALQLKGDERILEIGTGSGYQSAVLHRRLPEGPLPGPAGGPLAADRQGEHRLLRHGLGRLECLHRIQ